MLKTLLIFSLLYFVCSCTNENHNENPNLDSSSNKINEKPLHELLLGNWERNYYKVFNTNETIYFDSLQRNYNLIFNNNGEFIEKSNESKDTMRWSTGNKPLRIFLTNDKQKDVLDHLRTLLIEELNDSILQVYSESPLYPDAKPGHIIKSRMRFKKVTDE